MGKLAVPYLCIFLYRSLTFFSSFFGVYLLHFAPASLHFICTHKIKKGTFIVPLLLLLFTFLHLHCTFYLCLSSTFIAPGFVFDISLFSILSLLLFYFYLHICCINIWGLCVLYCVFLFYFLYLHFYKILL